MENSSSERHEDIETASSGTLLELLVSRLAEPAVITDETLTVLAANDPLTMALGLDEPPLGEPLSDSFQRLSSDAIGRTIGTAASLTVQTETNRWLEFRFDRHDTASGTRFLAVGRDVTTHRRRERTLERLFDSVPDGVYTVDDAGTIQSANSALESITGYDCEELVGARVSFVVDGGVIQRPKQLRELADTDGRVTLTSQIGTEDGQTVSVETTFLTRDTDGPGSHIGIVSDSATQRHSDTLTALHGATRDLFYAESKAAVANHTTQTVTNVLGRAGATMYLFDPCQNVLWPAGVSGAAGADERRPVDDGGIVRETFLGTETRTAGRRDAYYPLDNYGVLHVHSDGSAPEDVIETLTQDVEAALDRIGREETLREREAEHDERHERLRQLQRHNELIRSVDRTLIESKSREEIEQAVCEELAATEGVAFAWIGSNERDRLEPRQWAGSGLAYLDAVSLSTSQAHGPPAIRTACSSEPTVVRPIPDDSSGERWQTEALARNFQEGISVPLAHDNADYGVLTIYADSPGQFADGRQSIFVELGAQIASRLSDIERRQRRGRDSITELELRLTAPDAPTSRLATKLETELSCVDTVPVDDETTRLFLDIPDTASETVQTAIETVRGLDSEIVVGDSDRYELLVDEQTILDVVLARGGDPGTLSTDGERTTLTVSLAARADVRSFVEQLQQQYETVELTARRERVDTHRTQSGMQAAVESALTDRQLEVLQTAYDSGFFEWPRVKTGQEIAAMLDVSQPTVNRHLRVSERKVFELLFDTESRRHE